MDWWLKFVWCRLTPINWSVWMWIKSLYIHWVIVNTFQAWDTPTRATTGSLVRRDCWFYAPCSWLCASCSWLCASCSWFCASCCWLYASYSWFCAPCSSGSHPSACAEPSAVKPHHEGGIAEQRVISRWEQWRIRSGIVKAYQCGDDERWDLESWAQAGTTSRPPTGGLRALYQGTRR